MTPCNWARFRGIGYLPPSKPLATVLASCWVIRALRGER